MSEHLRARRGPASTATRVAESAGAGEGASVAIAAAEVGGQRVGPGERRRLWLPLGHRPDGGPLGLPLVVVRGALPGPTLGVVAGVHGDEYEGPEALRRFLAGLDPARLRGTVVATPQANPPAFEAGQRTGAVDHLDLNRAFPGRPDGFLTQRIADLLVGEVVGPADALVDLHGGGWCGQRRSPRPRAGRPRCRRRAPEP